LGAFSSHCDVVTIHDFGEFTDGHVSVFVHSEPVCVYTKISLEVVFLNFF
jgi:hypothetical protein